MKIKFLSLLSFVSICSLLISTTYHIKQDGTGDFTTIQEGIDASTDSDTVLVYTGTYLENINFNGKCITVASLYLYTGDEQYIYQTIINGNQNGSCVRIKSGENDTTVLCGFTLINGNGSSYSTSDIKYGGGILIKDSQPNINNCIIKDNLAYSGGGICGINSEISLKGVTIKNNHAYHAGGGIVVGNSTIDFDENELCNIYLNFAAMGCDIAKGDSNPFMVVIVDTFTVAEPDGYYIWNYSSVGYPLNDVTLISQNSKLEPINADLYVSTVGDNNNSGLVEDEPLATINYALSLVKSDSLHPNTIRIANGLYSKTENNQHFPLCMRGYISLSGESMQNTILDANHISEFIRDDYSELNYTINNLTFVNGGNTNTYCSTAFITAWYKQNKNIVLDSISCNNCYGYSYAMNLIYADISISDLYFKSNYEGCLTARNSHSSNIVIQVNNVINNDIHQFNPTSMSSDAKPQYLFGGLGTRQLLVNFTNVEITENIQTQSDWPKTSAGICLGDSVTLNLINCTIGNNTSPGDGGVILFDSYSKSSIVNIYNSILYGNSPGEIYINNGASEFPATVNIQNSLVMGGEAGIQNPYSWNQVYWLDGNLNEDPLWLGTGDYPYFLQSSSPCIDAGTLDLPTGIELPQYDLAGNPRIYGDTIDMGAYEWQGVGTEEPEIPQLSPFKTKISNYPNPFNPSTIIKLELAEAGKIVLAIYNIKGQRVKTLLDCSTAPGTYECNWKGKDEMGKSVSSGQYIIKLKQNEKETATKIMLLK